MQVDPYATTNALSDGFNQQQAMAQSRARRVAGNALAGGNTAGAMSALGGAGDLQGQRVLQSDMTRDADQMREREAAERTEKLTFILRGAEGLLQAPPEQRREIYQTTLRPVLQQMGYPDDVLSRLDSSEMSDAQLRSLVTAVGGEVRQAPAGYRWVGDRQEPIPGGPADPANQRWQVTPYGLIPPAGWSPSSGGGAQSAEPEYIDELPPGVRPRPNQPSPARPATGGGRERDQPVSVSFQSSRDAQAAIMELVPGVEVTSGRRSPDEQRRLIAQWEAGGRRGIRPSDTSFHLQDRARDLVPPPGMTMGQLAAKMRQAGFRALNEGDHVHVSW
jgi:hypothetical protein